MIEFNKEHSSTWLELMAAYQNFREKIFYWAKENDNTKYHDLSIELSTPILERDLFKRLLIIDFLQSTDMWDETAILLIYKQLTDIALQEQDEIAAGARIALQKIRPQSQRANIADEIFAFAAIEAEKKEPDCIVFHNGWMLLYDLNCKEQLEQFIDKYHHFIYLACGFDETDLRKLVECM